MSDQETPAPKPTVASAWAAAENAQESASLALATSQAQGQKLDKVASEQVALAQAFSLMRERFDKLATGLDATVVVSKLDGLSSRLETMEQRTAGETADWGPVIKAQNERLHKLDALQRELTGKFDDFTKWVTENVSAHVAQNSADRATVDETRDPGNTLADRIDEAFNQIKSLYESVAAIGEKLPVEEINFDRQFDERLRRLVAHRGSFEQDLLARLENLERRLPGAGLFELSGGNTASAKVLELMRLIPNIGKDKDFESKQAKFKFRGIDQAMDWTGWAMREVGLTLRTKVLGRETTHDAVEKQGNNGGYTQLWTSTLLTMRYVFVDPVTGHEHEFEMVGEGRDVADKSASKAAAMACKYALFQALMIPVEGLNDTDSDSERPVVEAPMDSPGRRVSQGKITAAQAVNEYMDRRYQGEAAGPNSDPAIGRPGNAHTMPDNEGDLMQRAAFAARHLIQALAEPPEVALLAVQKAKARIEQLGIGDYEVPFDLRDEARGPLNVLVAVTLQSINAAVNRGAGAQGVTRQGQQAGQGARAALDISTTAGEQEYLDALKILGSVAPEDAQRAAEVIIMEWESKHHD